MPDAPLDLPGYAHAYSGKVRDLYAPNATSAEAMALREGKSVMDLAIVEGYEGPQPDGG